MCVVSVLSGWGQIQPEKMWNTDSWKTFQELINVGEKFDKVAGQPDCIDPEKDAWMKRIEERITALEAAAFRNK
jgi:hypothetical protein